MRDDERIANVDQLRHSYSVAKARQGALLLETRDFEARLGQVREALGNPYFYSGKNHGRPENAEKSVAKYTGYASHEPGLQLIQSLKAVNLQVNTLREQLRELGVNVD